MKAAAALVIAAGSVYAQTGEQADNDEFYCLSESAGIFPEREAFRDLVPRFSVRPRQQKDGTWCLPLEQVKPPKRADGTPRPFYISTWARLGLTPGMFFAAKLDPRERERYLAFRKAHPEMLGMNVSEWLNDAKWARVRRPDGQPKWSGPKYEDPKRIRLRGPAVPPETYWKVMNDERVARATESRANYLSYLKWIFDRTKEICYNSPEDLFIGDGCFCGDHLVADWGAGQLWMETSRNYALWQVQLMFCRGAAAQYGLPFHWYVAGFWAGFDSTGERFKTDGHQTPDTPERGISLSAIRRAMYMTYLSGAKSFEREAGGQCWRYRSGAKSGQISPEGEMYEAFWRFCKSNPRGRPYRPAAIVAPRDRGYLRTGGKAFYGVFEYNRSDYLLDALMSVVLEYPKNRAVGMARSGVERVMANSKYGDVFDVIVPGGERPETFRNALGRYKVVFVAGEIPFDAEDRRALDAFVAAGGKLVDVGALVDNWEGPVRSFANIFPEEYDFWNDFNVPKDGPAPYAGFERLAAEVDRAVLPLHPFRVSGDVQFGFNRLPDGWLVYLVNNGGVKKFGDTRAEFFPEPARVTLDVSGLGRVEVRELACGAKVDVEAETGKACLSVPSGDLRVVRLVLHTADENRQGGLSLTAGR